MSAGWWAVAIAAVSALLTGVGIWQGRRGPRKAPAFSLWRAGHGEPARYALILENTGGAPAKRARITFPGEQPPSVIGTLEHDRIDPGAGIKFTPSWRLANGPDKRVRVEWKPAHRDDPGSWESDEPPM